MLSDEEFVREMQFFYKTLRDKDSFDRLLASVFDTGYRCKSDRHEAITEKLQSKTNNIELV